MSGNTVELDYKIEEEEKKVYCKGRTIRNHRRGAKIFQWMIFFFFFGANCLHEFFFST